MRKPAFCICENKDEDQLRNEAQIISSTASLKGNACTDLGETGLEG